MTILSVFFLRVIAILRAWPLLHQRHRRRHSQIETNTEAETDKEADTETETETEGIKY